MKKKGLLALCMAALLALLPVLSLCQSAVIDNGNNPDNRLNVREAPSREARALGKFYSGTQVEILADAGGGWVQVQIGAGAGCVSGYAMSEYLHASSVIDARQQRSVVSPYGTPAVVLRDRPSNSYDAVAMLSVGERVTVIGVSGDFCYVTAVGGAVGCLKDDELR